MRQTPRSHALPLLKALRFLGAALVCGITGLASPPDLQASETATPHPSDPVAGRTHWAFQPLSDAAPSDRHPWSTGNLDDFIVARREAAGLEAAPNASPRDFLRRVTFQLTGLPPSPAQVEAFLNDSRPNARERLVDDLLNSPRFGERWGRHWLDLARYADSNGLDENFLFREAWRYRNWVIDAINGDVPYDRFLLEQLAGDLLPHNSIEQRDAQRIAAGFLVMGPKVLLGNNPENQRMEVAGEQIDTLGRALLGLTLGCARCHDHKFEPIPTADYYALAGIFTSTEVMERRHMLGQQRVMERLVGLGPEGDDLDAAYENYWRELPGKRQTLERAKPALDLLEKKDLETFQKHAEKHPGALAKDLADETLSLDLEERLSRQRDKVASLEKEIAQAPPIPPRAMIPRDLEEPRDEAIRQAGRFDQRGEVVPRGFLQVVSSPDSAQRPAIPPSQSGREALARWLTDTREGAGHLAARVLANRVWHHLIGRGLVRTVDNFGRTGETPSHPELLDHLARELIDSGWSLKALIRRIVLSRTFAMSSPHDADAHEIDPDNELLWRAHRRRLDPESLRDAMLMAAGALDLAWTDSTVNYLGDQATAVGKNENRRRTDFPCRSVYLPIIRNDLPEIFEVFNFADPHATTGARARTTAATQGLFLLNDPSVMDAARAMVRRLEKDPPSQSDPLKRIGRMFAWALQSPPTDDERRDFLTFIETQETQLAQDGHEQPSEEAWALACHALFALSRFQFLE